MHNACLLVYEAQLACFPQHTGSWQHNTAAVAAIPVRSCVVRNVQRGEALTSITGASCPADPVHPGQGS